MVSCWQVLIEQEGSGTAVMSAYVEIVFDNTDGRFPVPSTSLILMADRQR
jgi:hypothetical protein